MNPAPADRPGINRSITRARHRPSRRPLYRRDWEGDLLAGSRNTHIATLVERRSRYVMLARVRGKDTVQVVDTIVHGQ
jgi:IS30 family transposase